MILGPVERHYLKCPVCPGRADLRTHRCRGCGALAVAVEWRPGGPVSPELVAVSLTDNLRAVRR